MPDILIADDNAQIVEVLSRYAERDGFTVRVAADGEAALAEFRRSEPTVTLLDVMMPKLDGFAVCREIRTFSNAPVLMVTARGEDFERIMGLDIGADDYIVKPFSPGEVMARVRAVLRRGDGQVAAAKKVSLMGLSVDLDRYEVAIDGQPIRLTKKETEILWTLASHTNKVFSRENLLDSVWGHDYFGDPRVVDTHIKRLRAKLDAHDHPGWELATVWGVGYAIKAVDE